MNPLSDYLKKDLSILFVGFNPSLRSGEVGYHFANPRNRFWHILYLSGLTPRKYVPSEDKYLLDLGYGLTNIVSRPTKGAEDITKEEYKEGRIQLKDKILYFQPKIVCYVGKGVYEQFHQSKTKYWGLQKESELSPTMEFVAPSSSGLVRMKMEEIINIYQELAELVKG